MDKKIWLSPPHIGEEEMKYVQKAFDSNWIAPLGPNVDEFETRLSGYCKVGHAAALSSGTAAIHLALKLLGTQPGDHVMCQSFTFVGTVNPVLYENAVPVLIDSERDTWNMDPVLLEEAIESSINSGKKVRAIIPVHLYGMPAKMNEIKEVALKYNIPVIEDAAEALGSFYENKPCGGLTDLGVLSFNGNKIITTSGGGALLSDNENLIKKSRNLSTQAREPYPHYEHTELGFNYRLSNVLAGIGIGQMSVLNDYVEKRRSNFGKYRTYFESLSSSGFHFDFQEEPIGSRSNRWLSAILMAPEKNNGITPSAVMTKLAEHGIESRPLWKPMHQQPLLESVPRYVNGCSDQLFSNGICLPSGSSLEERDFQRIYDVLNGVFS